MVKKTKSMPAAQKRHPSRSKPPARKKTGSRIVTKPRARKKAGRRIRMKPDSKLLRKLAELGLSTAVVDETALAIFLQLDGKGLRPAGMAFAYEAAITAMKAAAFASDDPQEWIRAARKAAGLPTG
jgi:hypothetical protein